MPEVIIEEATSEDSELSVDKSRKIAIPEDDPEDLESVTHPLGDSRATFNETLDLDNSQREYSMYSDASSDAGSTLEDGKKSSKSRRKKPKKDPKASKAKNTSCNTDACCAIF